MRFEQTPHESASTTLAIVIEQVRVALAAGENPDDRLKQRFLDALDRLIREALRPARGDTTFHAMVLRHRTPVVREYASLAAHANQDRRAIHAAVNAAAHPAKRQRMPAGALRDALTQLHALANAQDWDGLAACARNLQRLVDRGGGEGAKVNIDADTNDEVNINTDTNVSSGANSNGDGDTNVSSSVNSNGDSDTNASSTNSNGDTDNNTNFNVALTRSLHRLLDGQGLTRLQRLSALMAHEPVRQYRALWNRQGPPAGSAIAIEQGAASQQRGAAVEAQAARALQTLARRLNAQQGARTPYRVVTSMRASPSLPGSADYAKSEWDAVLLRQLPSDEATPIFDICLLIEAKASVDAAATDLPRLLRGLDLLASAAADTIYTFNTHQGIVRLRGDSLRALSSERTDLADNVLYCCDAAPEAHPRLLGTATRMQLLSAQGSVAYASGLSRPGPVDRRDLESVWEQLLTSARWETVRRQYPLLRRVRELMVHVADLSVAVNE